MSLVKKSRILIREELECPALLRRLGSGWISGVTGLILGIASIGMVLVMRFPGVFGTAEMAGLRGAGINGKLVPLGYWKQWWCLFARKK